MLPSKRLHRGLRSQDKHLLKQSQNRLYQGGSERLPFWNLALTGLSRRQSAALKETQEWPQRRKVPRDRTASNGKSQAEMGKVPGTRFDTDQVASLPFY